MRTVTNTTGKRRREEHRHRKHALDEIQKVNMKLDINSLVKSANDLEFESQGN